MKKGVKILIVCMALVIVGLVSYIITDKVGSKDEKNENKNVVNATTNEAVAEKNEVKEKNSTSDKEKNEGKSNNEGAKKIAEALKERRFMAKNGIDIEADARFMEVGDNIYLIRVTDEPSGTEYTTDFIVRYEDESAVFEKTETDKHSYDMYVDTKHHIVKAERTMKGYTFTKYYDVSEGKFDLKLEFGQPYIEGDVDYSDMYKYQIDGEEVDEDTYNERFSNTSYNKYNYVSFDENARILNDDNIDEYVK